MDEQKLVELMKNMIREEVPEMIRTEVPPDYSGNGSGYDPLGIRTYQKRYITC